MQAEAQMTSAASSPDPLAVDGPNGRDIDPLAVFPTFVDGPGRRRNYRPDFFRLFWEFLSLFESV